MPRDYAKPRNPNAGRRPAPRGGNGARRPGSGGGGSSVLPGWAWGVVASAAVAVIAAFVWIDRPEHRTRLGEAAVKDSDASALVSPKPVPGVAGAANGNRSKPAAAAPAATKPGAAAKAAPPSPLAAPAPATEETRSYSFYRELPKIEVPIPREYSRPPPAGKPAPKPPPEIREALAAPGAYLVQVGAFKTREDADRQRARLALIGYASRIEQGAAGNGSVVFRVRIGPEASLPAAQSVIARLDDNGIDGFVVKLRD